MRDLEQRVNFANRTDDLNGVRQYTLDTASMASSRLRVRMGATLSSYCPTILAPAISTVS